MIFRYGLPCILGSWEKPLGQLQNLGYCFLYLLFRPLEFLQHITDSSVYKAIIDEAMNEQEERKSLGFSNRFEFAVYGELNPIIDGKAAVTITKQIFKEIEPESKIVGWKNKPNSERKMGLAVYDVLQENKWPEEKIEETISKIQVFVLPEST